MPDEYIDPSGNTAQFRAFVAETESEPETSRRVGLIVAIVVLAVAAVALAIWALS